MINTILPVEHFSASAIQSYLSDKYGFYKTYIAKEYEFRQNISSVEGKVVHKILAQYYSNPKDFNILLVDQYLQDAFMEYSDTIEGLDFGKTGSLTKTIKKLKTLLDLYLLEPPQFDEVLEVETQFKTQVSLLDGTLFPVPLKGYVDLVQKRGDEIIIVDHKTVASFDDNVVDNPAYMIQAAVYYYILSAVYPDFKVSKFVINQIKKSINRDGSPQHRQDEMIFTHDLLVVFESILTGVYRELTTGSLINPKTGKMEFLPNPLPKFGGKEAWVDYCKQVLLNPQNND
jgi:hypothetical protein